ncbi:MAG: ATP-binding protein [Pseudomonadota bacterium]|nr:ATP-binding protein [Pseudomonadota bacterium]
MPRDPTLIGTVESVNGATVSVELTADSATGLTFVNGEGYRIGQVGSFVRIPLGHTNLYGVVSQVGAGAAPIREGATSPYGKLWLTVQLVGEGRRGGRFARGVSQHPTIQDRVHIVTDTDLQAIYGSGDLNDFVKVGHLASAESIPALVDISKLVTRHSAVVGTTGAGKSNTVAGILQALADPTLYQSARIVVFDIHGEYGRALRPWADVFRVDADPAKGEKPLFVPYWALEWDEFLKIGMGTLETRDQGPIQDRFAASKRAALKKFPKAGLTEERVTVDSLVPFSAHQLWYDLHCEMMATHLEVKGKAQSRDTWALEKDAAGGKDMLGDAMSVVPPTFRAIKDIKDDTDKVRLSTSTLSARRQVDSLASKLRDPRFDFMFKPGDWLPTLDGAVKCDLDQLIGAWVGGPQPISVLDLSGIPSVVLKDLIGALLRILYSAMFWARNRSEGGRERPLLLVLEEAHTYLSESQSGVAAEAIKRIAKEGRKYGVGLMLVSQRPSEIDSTILSQCGTIFAMRLANEKDRGHVTGAAADNLKGLFDMLPVLRTGEAVIVGEAVSLPTRTLIDRLPEERRPDSDDPRVVDRVQTETRNGTKIQGIPEGAGGWNRGREPGDYAGVVEQMRRQNPHYKHGNAKANNPDKPAEEGES